MTQLVPALLALSLLAGPIPAKDRRPAPAFAGANAFLNVSRPLAVEDLSGRVVILDFWTLGCINCLHVIPELAALEHTFAAEPFAVVGIHSGKFEEEKQVEEIRRAVRRLGLTHPVVVDSDFKVWDAYGVRAWPTLVVLDARGRVALSVSGEGHGKLLEATVRTLLAEARAERLAPKSPLPLSAEREEESPLRFPGKVAVDGAGQRLAVADTGHHRIVLATIGGTVLAVYGDGTPGRDDGAKPRFRAPQGLAFAGETLHVADTGNHLVRAIDLQAGVTRTVAGSGAKGSSHEREGPARQVALSSPWDLALSGDLLHVAMAGVHQLWTVELRRDRAGPLAGSGREGLVDGRKETAQLAQPMGLALGGPYLWFTDAESSAIRSLDPRDGTVETTVGRGLFAFGDKDGNGRAALLEHPQGLAFRDGALFIADTYNHKIRRLDPVSREVKTLLGTGTRGAGPGQLSDPGGLAALPGRLLVADTGNHRLVKLELSTGKATELRLVGLAPPGAARPEAPDAARAAQGRVRLAGLELAPGAGTLTVAVSESGGHLSAEAPARLEVVGGGVPVVAPRVVTGKDLPAILHYSDLGEGPTELLVDARVAICTEVPVKACVLHQVRVAVPVQVRAGAPAAATVTLPGLP